MRVADAVDAGLVWINIVLGDAAELPFGGVKRLGSGRETSCYARGNSSIGSSSPSVDSSSPQSFIEHRACDFGGYVAAFCYHYLAH